MRGLFETGSYIVYGDHVADVHAITRFEITAFYLKGKLVDDDGEKVDVFQAQLQST